MLQSQLKFWFQDTESGDIEFLCNVAAFESDKLCIFCGHKQSAEVEASYLLVSYLLHKVTSVYHGGELHPSVGRLW